jgi:hypothetical protein
LTPSALRSSNLLAGNRSRQEQARFKSPVVQGDRHLLSVLRYIEANPLTHTVNPFWNVRAAHEGSDVGVEGDVDHAWTPPAGTSWTPLASTHGHDALNRKRFSGSSASFGCLRGRPKRGRRLGSCVQRQTPAGKAVKML